MGRTLSQRQVWLFFSAGILAAGVACSWPGYRAHRHDTALAHLAELGAELGTCDPAMSLAPRPVESWLRDESPTGA